MMSTLSIESSKSKPEVSLKDKLGFRNKSLSLKYRHVTRMLYGTKLKYWYYFSKLGQRLGAAQVREQSIASGVTHPPWHLLLPSALQTIGKYWQTPWSLPAPCPWRQAEERLEIHNHSPLPRCSTLPTPKLNKQFIRDTFQQQHSCSRPPDILIKNKEV